MKNIGYNIRSPFDLVQFLGHCSENVHQCGWSSLKFSVSQDVYESVTLYVWDQLRVSFGVEEE